MKRAFFSPRSRLAAPLLSVCLLLVALPARSQAPGPGLAWSLGYDPETFDPAKVDDQASELVRYLTAGVLLRVNRATGAVEPSLAESWAVSPDGRTATFHLRRGLLFSDGLPLSAADVAWSIRRVLAQETAAPVAEEFLRPREVSVEAPDAATVIVRLPARLVELDHIFDEVAIEPQNRPSAAQVTAGPFRLAAYQRGQFVRLERNPHYWKHDASGAPLPYLPSLQLDIVASDEQDHLRFARGQYGLLNQPSPDYFNLLARTMPQAAHDLGPSLNTEQLWFNQAPTAPLPAYEKQWFATTAFRVAVSRAIHRADLVRLAYAGHATPAYGFISPANHAWYDPRLEAPHEDVTAARALLASAGFRRAGSGSHPVLLDPTGHPVRFSILTNAGNAPRARMATLIQQDLQALGIETTLVALDFPALMERLMHTQNYEACLLGLANVDPDPNAAMNLWLSSSPNHQWSPSEKVPATPWEKQIDVAMRAQATAPTFAERLRAVKQVQAIVAEQQPFLYLVYPNVLYGVSPALAGVQLSILQPGAVWNIDTLHWAKRKP
ncbi:MAG TPA: ABC transporter substrate-binding protein [Acidobacteriaceae bacterium]